VLVHEARLVLDRWLIGSTRQRPFVAWCRVAGLSVKQAEAAAVAELRGATYVVIFRDGQVEEGIPNGHGVGRFQLPNRRLIPPLRAPP